MNKLSKEIGFFKSQPRPMRVLLATNFIYSLVIPVIELFIGAYIIRNSSNLSLVMVFQLAQATGIPITFLLNAYLLKYISICRMYSAGMILSSISMALMMLTKSPDLGGVMISGLIMGFSYGFFWANRNFLALTSTQNDNRNYYYGLETFFSALSVIIVPFAAGLFIAAVPGIKWINGNVNIAYYILTGGVFILTLTAAYLAHQGRFKNPAVAPKLYLEFHTIWDKTLGLSALRGLAWGYIIAAPVMLIMKLVGSEGSLGLIQSAGALLSAIMLYVLGRKARPEHRLRILRFGLFLFLAGAIVNSAVYNAAGVIIFVGCLVFARPLLDLAYYPIQLGVIEFLAKKEGRNQFTYLFTNEVALYIGRLAGCGLFILSSRYVSDYWALRYVMLLIALAYSCSWLVARSILKDPAWKEPVKNDQQTLEQLKEPIEL